MKRNKIIVTGFSGFVARHFVDYLFENRLEADILGIDINEPAIDLLKYNTILDITFKQINLLDLQQLKTAVKSFCPTMVLHLASYSSVAYSWNNPEESFVNNTNIFLNLVSVIRETNKDCRILSVGSSEEYGNVTEEDLPLLETTKLNPQSPYAVARVSQELLAKVFVESYDMKIILTRSFNHIGPFQDERFVVPSFIRRILDIKESGQTSGVIETGDIAIVRDFLDVRDVVKAYWSLLLEGIPGELYNICSGKGIPLKEVIDVISQKIGVEIQTKVNSNYVRPCDNKIIVGSYEKINRKTGWEPSISLEETISEMINIMRK